MHSVYYASCYIKTAQLLVIVSVYIDGLWFSVGYRSEDSQMDWLYSVVILRKYHVEIVPAATPVSTPQLGKYSCS